MIAKYSGYMVIWTPWEINTCTDSTAHMIIQHCSRDHTALFTWSYSTAHMIIRHCSRDYSALLAWSYSTAHMIIQYFNRKQFQHWWSRRMRIRRLPRLPKHGKSQNEKRKELLRQPLKVKQRRKHRPSNLNRYSILIGYISYHGIAEKRIWIRAQWQRGYSSSHQYQPWWP